MSKSNDYEIILEEIVRRVTGLLVEHVDDGSINGMHDADIHYPDGHVAAMEITTVADQAALQMQAFPTHIDLPDSPHWWRLLYPGKSISRKDIARHVPVIVRLLDQLDLDDADRGEEWLEGTVEWTWYEEADLSLRRYRGSAAKGRVDILPTGFGGAVDEHLEGLSAWVESLQTEKLWIENVDKLARSGRKELHLVLRLHESAVPFPLWYAMAHEVEIRSPEPTAMDPLTDLWLVVGSGTATRWSKDVGWSSHAFRQQWS